VAVDEVRQRFPEHAIDAVGDGQGGSYIVIHGVDIGDHYVQAESWLGFHISFQYPAADVYPHYVRPDLMRRDSQPLPAGLAATTWVHGNQPVIQVSRRSNRWDPARDTASLKALRVIDWLRTTT